MCYKTYFILNKFCTFVLTLKIKAMEFTTEELEQLLEEIRIEGIKLNL